MLHNKDIKNLSELKSTFVQKHKKADFFLEFISILKLGKLQAVFSRSKQKGISSLSIIRLLLVFPFIDQKSVLSFTESYWHQFAGFGKDAYYRLKNNSKINWRSFLFGIVNLLLTTIENKKTDEQKQDTTTTAFIFDDTITAKTGKYIEGTSRIWDHVIQKSVLGFKILVMGYYDGTMFIPIDFSIHRSKGRNKKKPYGLAPKHYKKQFKKKRDKNTTGFKRKKELDISKIESAIKMIKRAVKRNIIADYVLADSWYGCWKIVKETLENNMNYIGMFSVYKTLFTYRNKKITYAQIRHLNRKKVKRNKRFNLYYIRTVVNWNGQNVVLIFTRKGKKGNWKTLISTDLSLNFNKTIEIYQIRWTIEVFFKESKQSLGLGKSQSNDFDAQIADTTIVMAQYLFLALQNRVDKYETLGQLFKNTKENLVELRLHQRLMGLLIAIIEIIGSLFEEVDAEEIMQKAINNQEVLTKLLRLIDYPEDKHKKIA